MNLSFIDPGIVFLLGTFGCLIAARAGVFCIAIEAIVLNSACACALAASQYGNWSAGIAIGMLVGVITAGVFIIFHVVGNMDAIVSGIGINLMSLGLASTVMYRMNGDKDVRLIDNLAFEGGSAFHGLVIVISSIAVLAMLIAMGLSVHRNRYIAVGRTPDVAMYADVSIKKYRAYSVVWCGVIGGLGGVYYAGAYGGFNIGQWREGIGFIMLALAYATRGRVSIVASITVAFAVVRTWSLGPPDWLNAAVPAQFVESMPYLFILVLFATAGVVARIADNGNGTIRRATKDQSAQ
jgi:simple sugar transport system permease protein